MVKLFDKLIVCIIRQLNKLHLYFTNKYHLKKIHYKYMIPEKNAKNIKNYELQLLEALENNDIKNIAVTGDYGAGKSSFLKTFELKHPEYTFLDISLATFEKNRDNISLIEKSILEQIFYKESHKNIPQSRFKRINSYKYIWFKTIIAVLALLSLIYIIKPKFLLNLDIYQKIQNLQNKIEYLNLEYISIGILLIGIFFSLKYFIKNYNGFTLNKFNLQNIEIESKKEKEESLLNKYLDEILYFFEKTKYDIVVFQDLDRFENSKIFIKLRELNNFINKSKQVNKRVVFIYVLKDEIFKNQNERVKFFDVIIPIIPYINTKTSYDTLIGWFKEEKINKQFLKDISIYIYDMRLLKNIFNEYKIFKLQIGKNLDNTKLLAMIIYKNFYPKDYSKLYQGKSIINNLIKNRIKYLQKQEKNYLQHIAKKQKQIENYKKDLENNIDIQELRKIYIFEIIKELNTSNSFYCDNQQISISNAIKDEFFEKIKKSKNLKKDSYQYSKKISFQDIENKVNEDLTYQEREDIILNRINNEIEILDNEIKYIYKKIDDLNKLTFKELLKESNLLNNLKQEYELLKYLLLEGYIGEDYYLYISFDMQNALSQNDIEYIKAVKTNRKLPNNYQLNNIDEILENLNNNDFHQKSILNINLINYLLEHKKRYKNRLEYIFEYLSNNTDEEIERFVAFCIDWISNKNLFIKYIIKYNSNTWNIIERYGQKQSLNSYCGWIFYYADIEDIKKLKDFKAYFENKAFIQSFSDNKAKKVIQYIKDFNIKFLKLDNCNSIDIKKYIFENNHYIINIKMVNYMIFNFIAPKKEIEESLKIAHLSTIKTTKEDNKKFILNYIKANINDYINNVFLQIDTNTKENESTIIKLLNNEGLDFNLKIKIIGKEENKITDISTINNKELWKEFFSLNKIKATWNNLSYYYEYLDEEFDETLISYLNNVENAKELSSTIIDEDYIDKNKNFNENILNNIIENNQIENESYKLLLSSNSFQYEKINIEKLNSEKINILIDFNKFELSDTNINILKEYNLHLKFIIRNIEEFLENIDEFINILDDKDILQILLSNVDDDKKINIVKHYDINSIEDKNLVLKIFKVFNNNSIPLDSNFIIDKAYLLEENLDLINKQIKINSNLDCDDLKNMFDKFNYPYNALTNKSATRLEIEKNQNNENLLNILKNRDCISSFPMKGNIFIVYRKRKRK